jgi:hypothetical protein
MYVLQEDIKQAGPELCQAQVELGLAKSGRPVSRPGRWMQDIAKLRLTQSSLVELELGLIFAKENDSIPFV